MQKYINLEDLKQLKQRIDAVKTTQDKQAIIKDYNLKPESVAVLLRHSVSS